MFERASFSLRSSTECFLPAFAPCVVPADLAPPLPEPADFFAASHEGLSFGSAAAAAPVAETLCDDLSLPLSSPLLMPGVSLLTSPLPHGGLSAASCPPLPWEMKEKSECEPLLSLSCCDDAEEWEEDLSGLRFLCAAPVRLLPRSLSLAWWQAVEVQWGDTQPLERKPVEDDGVWKKGDHEDESEGEWQLMEPLSNSGHELRQLPLSGISMLSGLDETVRAASLPALPTPEQLCIPLADSVVFPSDSECPGASLLLPIPPHLQNESSDRALLAARVPALSEEPPRCSLVSLELQMSTATLPLRPVLVASERAMLRFQIGPAVKQDEFNVAPLPNPAIPAVVGPPVLQPVSFEDHVKATDDDQFIESARAETQRLAGYHDNGRGDIHHFLAMCADFSSHNALFALPAVEEPVFVQPKAPKAAAAVAQTTVRPVSQAAIRPLSRRGAVPVAAPIVTAPPPAVPVAAVTPPKAGTEDLLSSYMKTRGVEPKKTWSLQSFVPADDAASDRVLALLKTQKLVRVAAPNPSKSMLPVALLVAAKHASKDDGCAVCIHEHLAIAKAHLVHHVDAFVGVRFDSRIKSKTVVYVDGAFELPSLPPKCIVIICGSAAFTRQHSAGTVLVVAGTAEPASSFDIVLDPLPRLSYELAVLPTAVRRLVHSLEKHLAVIAEVPSVRQLSADSLQKALDELPPLVENGSVAIALVLLHIGKTVADLAGSRSVGIAAAHLECAFRHPVFGARAREEFKQLAAVMGTASSGSDHVKNSALTELLLQRSGGAESAVLVLTDQRDLLRIPNSRVRTESAAAALSDAFFPWSSFHRVLVVDCESNTGDALEVMRVKNPAAAVSWLLTDYEMTRSSHVAWESAPAATQVATTFGVAFDWKCFISVEAEELDGVRVIASHQLVANWPRLAASLSSSFGLSLVQRSNMAADLVVDECRCLVVRNMPPATGDDLRATLLRVSCAFTECVLILRHPADAPEPTLLLHQLTDAADTVCPSLLLRVIITREVEDHEVELGAVSALLRRSRERSSLRRVGQGGWSAREWLDPSESSHESVLSCFPSLSPLSAQLLLSQFSLSHIFRAPGDVQSTMAALVPARSLEDLWAFLRQERHPSRPYTNPKRGEIQKHASKLTLNKPAPRSRTGQTTLNLVKK